MVTDQVWVLDGDDPQPARETTMPRKSLKERSDLQKWIIDHPELIEDGLLVLTQEYDRWAVTEGRAVKDRLDLLALDSAGQLVVIELKRDEAPTNVHLQAITYAAMVSRCTEDDLASIYAKFLTDQDKRLVSDEEAAELIRRHVGTELDPQLLQQPRLILVSREFPRQVTSSAVWLNEMGINLKLVEIRLWETSDGAPPVLTTSTRYPVPGTEEFVVEPARSATVKTTRRAETRKRAERAVKRLVSSKVIKDDTLFRLVMQSDVSTTTRDEIEKWIEEQPDRGCADWVNVAVNPLRWKHDGLLYTPTGLVKEIVGRASGSASQAINGPRWWVDGDGRSITDIADALDQIIQEDS